MRKIETTVTYLEMTVEPHPHIPPPAKLKLLLMRAERPSVGFYRYLYNTAGRDYHWVDRARLGDTELAGIIGGERVEIWVLYALGEPAGFFEINGRDGSVVELQYLALLPQFHGLGLARWFLAEAIRACWARKPERVIVETCTLDAPAALPLYQKLGFVPYDRKVKTIEIPE